MNFSYRVGWLCFRAMFKTYFRWRVYDPENVPVKGPVILASNHASYLDPPLVGCGVNRHINFMARETLFRFAVTKWLFRSWKVIPVDRDGTSPSGLRRVLECLANGGAVVLFPEGTRTRDGQLQPARSGVGLAVIKSDAAVVPARVFGTFEAYGRHMKFPKPRRVAVAYGRPMYFEELRAEAKSCSKERLRGIYQQIADEIMAAVARLEPRPQRSRGVSNQS